MVLASNSTLGHCSLLVLSCQVISQTQAFFAVPCIRNYLSGQFYQNTSFARQEQNCLCLLCAEASAFDAQGEGVTGAASNSSVYVDIVGGETSADTGMPDQLPGAVLQQQIEAAILCKPVPYSCIFLSTCQRLLCRCFVTQPSLLRTA